MADLYCQPQLYCDINTNNYNPPAYGFCMDGDGLATGKATLATVSIDLTGFAAAAGNTLQIAGATLTCVASGAGTNQFNAGSGAALVTALVAAINSATVAVPLNNSQFPGWLKTTQMRDLFRTRVNPGNTSIIDISTTVGSALFNATSYFSVVSTGFTGGTVNATFSGGASGAWGTLFNGYNLFASGIGQSTYGILCQNGVLAGVRNPGDIVRIRPVSFGFPAGPNYINKFAAGLGSASAPVRHIVDPAPWGDSASTIMTMTQALGGFSNSMVLSGSTPDTYASLEGQIIGGDVNQRNLVFVANVSAGQAGIFIFTGGNVRYENFEINHQSSSGGSGGVGVGLGNNQGSPTENTLVNIKFRHAGSSPFMIGNGGALSSTVRYTKCVFDNGTNAGAVAASPHTGVLVAGTPFNNTVQIFDECKFNNFCSGSNLFNSTGGGNAGFQTNGRTQFATLKNCDFGGVTFRGPYLANQTSPLNAVACDPAAFISIYNTFKVTNSAGQTINRDFSFETWSGMTEWNSQKVQPYLNASLPDGSGWSYKFNPPVTSTNINPWHPYELPAITKVNSLADGVRSITIEFLLHSTLAWTMRDLSVQIDAQGVDGSIVSMDSWNVTGPALTRSTAAWTGLAGSASDPASLVQFNDGGVNNYTRYSITLATPVAIKGGEAIIVTPRVHNNVSTVKQCVFVDPDFTVA